MQNKGTDYIRRILRDKARQKRWRQIMLCLSCIVVFCTIYVLILPAITLEKKTTCEEEQSAIQEEQPLVQEEDESIVQSTIQSDDSEDIEFVSCEPIEEETDDVEEVEITEDPEEEMDVDFASGEEDAIEAADENVMPEGGIAGGFDLSAEVPEAAEKRDYVKLSYKKEDGTWQEFSQENNAPEVSGNPPVRLEVKYKNVQISNLLNSYNCKLTYQLPTLLRDAKTAGKIMEGNQQVGTVTCENGKIVVEFDRSYLQGLLDKGDTTTTIAGDFYAEGNVDLSQLNPDGTTTLSTAGKTYYLNLGPDAVAKYGKINIEKTCVSQQAISTESGNYLAYTITVTAGEDGCPDVSVVDTIENKTSVDSYVGIDTTAKTLVTVQNGQNPYETIAEGKTHGTVYLGNTTTDSTNPVPTPGAVDITTASGSMVWKIGDMAAGEIRTLTYYVKLKDNVGLNDNEIKNKADVYSKTYKRVYDDASFTPKINYTMPKSHNENIVRNSDGTYTITYKIEFNLDGNNSNYALKNLEFRDYLDDQSDNIHTDSNALPYISYNRDSVKLYKGGVELPSKDYTVSWANEVDQIHIVEPIDYGLLNIEEGEDLCTLLTCTPYGINTERLLVRGHRIANRSGDNSRITSDAAKVSTVLVAVGIGIPLLIISFIAVDVSERVPKRKKKSKNRRRKATIQTRAKRIRTKQTSGRRR